MRFDLEQYRLQESAAGRATRPSAGKRIRTEGHEDHKGRDGSGFGVMMVSAVLRNPQRPANAKLRTPNPELQSPNSKPRTPKTANGERRTASGERRAANGER